MMPEEDIEEINIDDIDIDDIITPGQEEEQNTAEVVAEGETIEFNELYTNPSQTIRTNVEDDIDEDAVEFSQLYETTENEEESVVEDVVEEVLHQETEQIPSAPETSNERIRSASNNLEHIVQSVIQDDTNSLAATEIDIMEKEINEDYQKIVEKDKAAGKDLNTLAMYEHQKWGYRF